MFSGSDPQRSLAKNAKAGGVVGDENAVVATLATKSKLLMSSSYTDGDSRKASLSTHKPILGESKRAIMVDKSNHHDLTLAPSISNKDTTVASRQLQQQPSETLHTQRKSLSATTISAIRPLVQQKSRQEAAETEAAKEAATVVEFFKDNKQRYKPTPTQSDKAKKRMEPTSILPILVPDRMKPRLREKYLTSSSHSSSSSNINISTKRSLDGMYQRSERLLSSFKRQKQLDQQLSNDKDGKSKTKGKENVDPNAPPGISALATTTTTTATIAYPSSPSSQQTTTDFSSACSSPTLSQPKQPPPPPRRPTAALLESISSTHITVKQPSFSTIESKNIEKPHLNVDQETIDEASKQEQLEERRARQNILQTSQVSQKSGEQYDDDESNDPMLVAEYADEILSYLRATENETLVNTDYVSTIQHEVTWRMRDVLIDWVIEVHYIFQLLPETLFLTVNIIDRFLARRDVSMGKLQLVGIASLFVATKFEETISPPIKQYLYVTGNMVTEEELLKSERYILQILDFKLCYPNPFHFFRRSTMAGNYDVNLRFLAKYFMEITIIDHRFLGTPPSLVAASAVWLAIKILCQGGWTPELVNASGYTVQEVKPVVELILDYLSQPINDKSFHKKWSSRRMLRVGLFVRNWVQRFYGKTS